MVLITVEGELCRLGFLIFLTLLSISPSGLSNIDYNKICRLSPAMLGKFKFLEGQGPNFGGGYLEFFRGGVKKFFIGGHKSRPPERGDPPPLHKYDLNTD